jgi:hypothetical protein
VIPLATTINGSHLGAFAAIIALGFVVGIFGHIIKSRTLIIIGIIMIGVVSMVFVFVISPRGN